MAGIWAAFLAFLLPILRPLIGRVLAALGLAVVTYQGFNAVVTLVVGKIQTAIGAIPSDLAAIIGLSGLDQGATIILSAYTSALAIKALSGSVKRLTGVSA